MEAEPHIEVFDSGRPILFVDVDGVLSLFGFPAAPPGPFHTVDGIPHCIPAAGGPRLDRLARTFELVWATGWEERANEYLPHILSLACRELPVLSFEGRGPGAAGGADGAADHWKLAAIDAYAGPDRAAAWIDDDLDGRCDAWAARRPGPTLLVHTDPATGLTDEHVAQLERWAAGLPTPPT